MATDNRTINQMAEEITVLAEENREAVGREHDQSLTILAEMAQSVVVSGEVAEESGDTGEAERAAATREVLDWLGSAAKVLVDTGSLPKIAAN